MCVLARQYKCSVQSTNVNSSEVFDAVPSIQQPVRILSSHNTNVICIVFSPFPRFVFSRFKVNPSEQGDSDNLTSIPFDADQLNDNIRDMGHGEMSTTLLYPVRVCQHSIILALDEFHCDALFFLRSLLSFALVCLWWKKNVFFGHKRWIL